jgi:tRNA G18 (ribose-2'-O)-methylase SpoU
MTPDPSAVPLDTVRPGEQVAVLIGSERSGLSAELLDIATPVRIPMAGDVDSLNAAAATAVVCWAFRPVDQPD